MNSFELDGILEKKDVIRYTLASVPILDLAIRHMSVVQEAGSDRKLSFSAEAAAVGPAAKALNEVELGSRLKFRGFLTTSSARSRKLVLHITEFERSKSWLLVPKERVDLVTLISRTRFSSVKILPLHS